MTKIVLYDIPSRFGTGTCWSLNVWKIRMILNYKGLDYETEWLRGPDIAATMQSFGLQPNEPGTAIADYSCPTVQMPDGRHIMNSMNIAPAIEAEYPVPSVHLDDPVFERVQDAWRKLLRAVAPELLPKMPERVLSGSSIEYNRVARAKTFGMPLPELEAKAGGEVAWEQAKPALQVLADNLKEHPEGPFCLGEVTSYADFFIAGFLEWARVCGGFMFDRVLEYDRVFKSLFEACQPWLERNNH